MSSSQSFESGSSRSLEERVVSGESSSSSSSSSSGSTVRQYYSSSPSSERIPSPVPVRVLPPVGFRLGRPMVRTRGGAAAAAAAPVSPYAWVADDAQRCVSQCLVAARVEYFAETFPLCPAGLEVQPCEVSDRIFHRPAKDGEFFVFACEYFRSLGVVFPLSQFECEVLSALSVAPSQLHPNSWGFIKAFEIVCRHLGLTPTANVFRSFHQLKHGERVGWVSLSGLQRLALLAPYSDSVKRWKDKFFKVRAVSDEARALYFVDPASGRSRFPLWWSWPRKYTVMEDALSEGEERVVEVLRMLPRPLGCRELIEAGRMGDSVERLDGMEYG